MLNTAKDVLERLEMMASNKQSGINVLSELQELIDKAKIATIEVYEAEVKIDRLSGRGMRLARPVRRTLA